VRSAKKWGVLTCGLSGPVVENISAVQMFGLYIWGMLIDRTRVVGLVTPEMDQDS
jgi:hypothetical protein